MKSTQQRTADYVARKKRAGLVRMYFWLKPEHREKVKRYVKRLEK